MVKSPVFVGIIAAFLMVVITIVIGGQGMAFLHLQSFILVFGGSMFATIASNSWNDIKAIPKMLQVMFKAESWSPQELIAMMGRFAEKARREGLLALEDEVMELEDEYLRKGIQLLVDGADGELVRSIMETELSFVEDRHKRGRGIFKTLGGFAPAFGMIGTLIGLIGMLKNLADPSQIGGGMATALVTTLYGTIFANVLFNPIANQLAGLTEKEILLKDIMIEGILSIQAGENPRIVEEKLKSFLPPNMRELAADEESEDEMVVDSNAAV